MAVHVDNNTILDLRLPDVNVELNQVLRREELALLVEKLHNELVSRGIYLSIICHISFELVTFCYISKNSTPSLDDCSSG